jgi:hypothetical protein
MRTLSRVAVGVKGACAVAGGRRSPRRAGEIRSEPAHLQANNRPRGPKEMPRGAVFAHPTRCMIMSYAAPCEISFRPAPVAANRSVGSQCRLVFAVDWSGGPATPGRSFMRC